MPSGAHFKSLVSNFSARQPSVVSADRGAIRTRRLTGWHANTLRHLRIRIVFTCCRRSRGIAFGGLYWVVWAQILPRLGNYALEKRVVKGEDGWTRNVFVKVPRS